MAVKTMKKWTLLAPRSQLDAILMILQEQQAIELRPVSTAPTLPEGAQPVEVAAKSTKTKEKTTSKSAAVYRPLQPEAEIKQLTQLLNMVRQQSEKLGDLLPKRSLLTRLKTERQTYTVAQLADQMPIDKVPTLVNEAKIWQQQILQLRTQQRDCQAQQRQLRPWREVDFNPQAVQNLHYFQVRLGFVKTNDLDTVKTKLAKQAQTYFEVLPQNESLNLVLVLTPRQQRQAIAAVLKQLPFTQATYPFANEPAVAWSQNQAVLQALQQAQAQLAQRPAALTNLVQDLQLAEEALFAARERAKAKAQILANDQLCLLNGWMNQKDIKRQEKQLQTLLGQNTFYTAVEAPSQADEEVPIQLANRRSTRAFENVVGMYAWPDYREQDPTPFVQPFMILFFGMMTADAGYGLLGLLVCGLALHFLQLNRKWRQNLIFGLQLMMGTTLAGLFFGSFFGFDLPFRVLSLNDQLLEVMGLSLVIGLIHLLLGLGLNAAKQWRQEAYAQSYLQGSAWILILLGATAIGVNALLSGPQYWTTVGLAMILGNLLGLVVVNVWSHKSKLGGLGQGLFGLLDVTSYLGDVISYTRLVALSVAGANIAMAFNLIIGLLPPWARFSVGILIFIALHAFNMFISMISGYVHSLRLNYVEFFGKFYQGGGHPFTPIALLGKHVDFQTAASSPQA